MLCLERLFPFRQKKILVKRVGTVQPSVFLRKFLICFPVLC